MVHLTQGNLANEAPSARVARSEMVVVPLGVFPSLTYQRRFHARQPDGYGNDESLLCPYYVKESGRCGVWMHRPSPCVSFFCESSYGIEGIEFWTRFEKFISSLELVLASEVLLRMGMTAPEIALSRRFLPRFGSPDPHGFTGSKLKTEEARSWLEFGGDRAAFFKRSYEIAQSVEPEEIARLMGEDERRAESDLLETRLARLLKNPR